MKQVLIKKGRALPIEVPAPAVSSGGVLIKVVRSCLSSGTELTGLAKSGDSLIRKAMEQPQKVAAALRMVKRQGTLHTIKQVRGILNAGSPTGYSLSGIVLAAGEGVGNLRPGDRVAAAGAGLANHAEYVDVPSNLVMRLPDGLGFDEAATVTLGGIALQGVRRADVRLGEFVLVLGAGVLGQLAVQLLVASGARTLVTDLDQRRLETAVQHGAEKAFHASKGDVVKDVTHYTGGRGVDSVVFCAATDTPQALSDAFAMTRKKGRVIMVGVWGDVLRRQDIYAKELDFLISTSYGPGRYDATYEEGGLDYPYAYVRWTENRNMEEYLRLLARNKVNVADLVQGTFPIEDAEQAFAFLAGPERPLTALLDYGAKLPGDFSRLETAPRRVVRQSSATSGSNDRIRVGVVGAGSFAVDTHLPNLLKMKDRFALRAICNRTGSSAQNIAERFKASYAATDYRELLDDSEIDLLMICTRHNLHGSMALDGLKAGKHVFVEKPLCVTPDELEGIKCFFETNEGNQQTPLLMPGFNRRFSKYSVAIRESVAGRINPLFITYTMNAGHIPLDHWVHSEEGGGRIVGEACHIVDLFSYLVGSPVRSLDAAGLRPATGAVGAMDNKSVVLEYEDGSVAALHYFAIGSKALPKERMEVHFDEKSIVLDSYKEMNTYGASSPALKTPHQSKGLLEELEALADALTGKGDGWPISLESMLETTAATFVLRD